MGTSLLNAVKGRIEFTTRIHAYENGLDISLQVCLSKIVQVCGYKFTSFL